MILVSLIFSGHCKHAEHLSCHYLESNGEGYETKLSMSAVTNAEILNLLVLSDVQVSKQKWFSLLEFRREGEAVSYFPVIL